MMKPRLDCGKKRGLALVTVLALMSLLIILLVGLLNLATREQSAGTESKDLAKAQATAKMAMVLALGDLQQFAGPDQRVTANAAGGESAGPVSNRHWLGVYKTTKTVGGREYPLIGKKADSGADGSPYEHAAIYSDLRKNDANWRESQRLQWLVSRDPAGNAAVDPGVALSDDDSVVLVGEGTLGDVARSGEQVVRVPKVELAGEGESIGYGYWVGGNNQKAGINLATDGDAESRLMVAQKNDPAAVESPNGGGYQGFYRDGDTAFADALDHVVTQESLTLLEGVDAAALAGNFHDFSVHTGGIHADTALGGLRKDLTPLLLGRRGAQEVSFAWPNSDPGNFPFVSSYPIIPSGRHALVGPAFNSLRQWAQRRYLPGLENGRVDAQVAAASGRNGLMYQPEDNWQPNRNVGGKWMGFKTDGYKFRWEDWDKEAPRLHPVMTDVRWHFYFGYQGAGASQRLVTYMIPRVCLWNPYSVEMRVPDLVVLMPNPTWRATGSFDMRFTPGEVSRLKNLSKYRSIPDVQNWNGWINVNPRAENPDNRNSASGLFPNARYLGFVLEGATLAAGECLVYSPKPVRDVVSSGRYRASRYDVNNVRNNVLSASEAQGESVFYHVRDRLDKIWIRSQDQWRTPPADFLSEARFGEIDRYDPWLLYTDNMPFVLKGNNAGAIPGVAPDELVAASGVSQDLPTLQLINFGNGGADTYSYWYYTWYWGNSSSASNNQFGRLQRFQEAPTKQPPAVHQFGAKLLWLDESANEGNNPPLRAGRWPADHVAFNQASIANWNIRPYLASRSPSSPCAYEWFVNVPAPWINQFVPSAPLDANDLPFPSKSGEYFAKPPLGASLQFAAAPRMALFDLPNAEHGVLSLGALRHAQLSPFSWHPSYVVGHSLADLHSPTGFSGNETLAEPFRANGNVKSRWDRDIGGSSPGPYGYGPRTYGINSQGLLQTGDQAPSNIQIDGQSLTADDEIYAYDIAFEVNQNLWDQFFVSSIPVDQNGTLEWRPATGSQPLANPRYTLDRNAYASEPDLEARLNAADGDRFAFWNSAYYVRNRSAFNVNSTSVEAWVAFLSGLRNLERKSTDAGQIGGDGLTVFARLFEPESTTPAGAGGAAPNAAEAMSGSRELSDAEIRALAEAVVEQVKERGPFISLADFINRRLEAQSSQRSAMGTLDAAIENAGLNSGFSPNAPFDRSTNKGTPVQGHYNSSDWQVDYERAPKTQAWGVPGFLTQGDLLESLAPAMTVRDDTFTIRTVGEVSRGGQVTARAYLEVVVERVPDFVQPLELATPSLPSGDNRLGNRAIDPVQTIRRDSGELVDGNLSELNQRFGRKFRVISARWLSPEEV